MQSSTSAAASRRSRNICWTAASPTSRSSTSLKRAWTTRESVSAPGPAAIQWIVADAAAWQPEREYALWHDRAVFHFLVEADDRRAYRRVLQRAVAAGGSVVVAAFAPDGPERCSGLPVQRHSAESFAAELGPEFALEETRREEHHTPAGGVQHFLWARFRRAP